MKGNLILGKASGRLGDLTTSITRGQQVTRSINPKPRNPRTEKQMTQRTRFSNVVSTFQIMASVIRGGYESKPEKFNDWNQFAKLNLGAVKVYLTKAESTAKVCVVAPYNISMGTLFPVELTRQGDTLVSSLRLPEGFSISETTTLGEVSVAIVKVNATIQTGDQISVIFLEQSLSPDVDNVPHAVLRKYEFTLNATSIVPFYTLVSPLLFSVVNTHIGTAAGIGEGGLAYVHSRRSGGKILVSTQSLVLMPGNTMYEKYSSEEKRLEAIKSYGAATLPFYDPDSDDTRADEGDSYFSVTNVLLNDNSVAQGSGELNVSSGDVFEIRGSKLTDVALKVNVTIGGPTAQPSTVALANIGTITASATSVTVNVTINGAINYLLRADDDSIIYNFE